MTYVDGRVIPVPHGKKAAPILQEYGALQIVEACEDDVANGQVTDFRRARQAHTAASSRSARPARTLRR